MVHPHDTNSNHGYPVTGGFDATQMYGHHSSYNCGNGGGEFSSIRYPLSHPSLAPPSSDHSTGDIGWRNLRGTANNTATAGHGNGDRYTFNNGRQNSTDGRMAEMGGYLCAPYPDVNTSAAARDGRGRFFNILPLINQYF